MNQIHIIAIAICFTSLTAWAQNITVTNRTDSLDIFSVIAGGVASFLLSKQANVRLMLNPFFQSNAIQGVYDINSLFILNASLRWASLRMISEILFFRETT